MLTVWPPADPSAAYRSASAATSSPRGKRGPVPRRRGVTAERQSGAPPRPASCGRPAGRLRGGDRRATPAGPPPTPSHPPQEQSVSRPGIVGAGTNATAPSPRRGTCGTRRRTLPLPPRRRRPAGSLGRSGARCGRVGPSRGVKRSSRPHAPRHCRPRHGVAEYRWLMPMGYARPALPRRRPVAHVYFEERLSGRLRHCASPFLRRQ